MKRFALAGILSACVTAPVVRPEPCPVVAEPAVVTPADEVAVRQVLQQFVTAVDEKNFANALALLSDDWRRRYSATRLEADFGLEPQGRVLIDRLKAALSAAPNVVGDRATLLVTADKYAVIEKTVNGWKIVSLDAAR